MNASSSNVQEIPLVVEVEDDTVVVEEELESQSRDYLRKTI